MPEIEIAVLNRMNLKKAMRDIAEQAFPRRGDELGEAWYFHRLDQLDENTKAAMDMFYKIPK
jgi:hypothetical protein